MYAQFNRHIMKECYTVRMLICRFFLSDRYTDTILPSHRPVTDRFSDLGSGGGGGGGSEGGGVTKKVFFFISPELTVKLLRSHFSRSSNSLH